MADQINLGVAFFNFPAILPLEIDMMYFPLALMPPWMETTELHTYCSWQIQQKVHLQTEYREWHIYIYTIEKCLHAFLTGLTHPNKNEERIAKHTTYVQVEVQRQYTGEWVTWGVKHKIQKGFYMELIAYNVAILLSNELPIPAPSWHHCQQRCPNWRSLH